MNNMKYFKNLQKLATGTHSLEEILKLIEHRNHLEFVIDNNVAEDGLPKRRTEKEDWN
jgi:hypothetical protein